MNYFFSLFFIHLTLAVTAQSMAVPDNLVTEGIPPLPAEEVEKTKTYTEMESATFCAWLPDNRGMLILKRYKNSNQVHVVKAPGETPQPLTFFSDPVSSIYVQPDSGDYFLFLKDTGGDEFSQLYRYDFSTQKSTLLTDGKRSQNGDVKWNHATDKKIAFGTTMRNGHDRDIYMLNPLRPQLEPVVTNEGGGWSVVEWTKDDEKLLLSERLSVNESRLYEYDIKAKSKTRLLPEKDERTTYSAVDFSKGEEGLYLMTNKDSEFTRLAFYEFSTRKLTFLSSVSWDVESVELSKDKTKLGYAVNENGFSKFYWMSLATRKSVAVTNIPQGVISSWNWSQDSKRIAFTVSSYNIPSDVFEYNIETRKVIRWTQSEMGRIHADALQAPQAIAWKSYDGRNITGNLYLPAKKFTGKHPVIIQIHGGPEGQSRPTFLGRSNYYMNELGIALIFPNVRGSDGYGKTFLDLDNGKKREESVKDIEALLTWIARQPELDAGRVMIMGGSYGGYMTLATSYHYSDRIRCSIDIVGISNFNTFLKNTEPYRRELRRVEYGDERDASMAAFFEEIAPINHVGEIKKPLFIIQGENDPRVPASESIRMKDKIKSAGGSVWFLMAKDEGHGFKKKNNVDFQFFATIAFVKQFLMGEVVR